METHIWLHFYSLSPKSLPRAGQMVPDLQWFNLEFFDLKTLNCEFALFLSWLHVL